MPTSDEFENDPDRPDSDAESGPVDEEAPDQEPKEEGGSGKRISLNEIRERLAEDPEEPDAERIRATIQKAVDGSGFGEKAKRVAESAARSVDISAIARAQAQVAGAFRSPAIENLVKQQAEMTRWRESQRVEMDSISKSMIDARRRQEERADSQAEATLEIARAQERLLQMQAQGIELATATANATADVAKAQQDVLETVREELAVLRDQAETLREQVVGQKRLLLSGWSGGVVMEWTLLVAVIAAVATIVLGVVGGDGIPGAVWVGSAVTLVLLASALGLWQFKRKPRDS